MILKLDGFIIVGVDEETDYSICDVTNDSNRRRTQDIVAFLREKKFAGGIRPTVYVQPLFFRKNEIDVIVIKNDRNTPYYLTEQYQGVFANNIYARIMDTNTPKNSSADINIVEKLWKKRFGIDATALERAHMFYKILRKNKSCVPQTLLQNAIWKTRQLQYTDRNAVLLLRLQGIRREQISHQSVCASRDAASAHKVLRHTWDWRVSQP